jgi:hypothetical protein
MFVSFCWKRVMTPPAIKHPVELLRDGKGIYGIGVAKEVEIDSRPKDLILRRDHLPESQPQRAVLQMITGGFRHGMFTRMSEEHLRQVIHHEMLRRAGLAWPPPDAPFHHNGRYWSSDPQQQTRNRQIYHGLRLGSLSIINRLIGHASKDHTPEGPDFPDLDINGRCETSPIRAGGFRRCHSPTGGCTPAAIGAIASRSSWCGHEQTALSFPRRVTPTTATAGWPFWQNQLAAGANAH